MNGEIKDRQLSALFAEAAQLAHSFHAALDDLIVIAEDFSDGSQDRFVHALADVNAIRAARWRVDQAIIVIEQTSSNRLEGEDQC